jgi:hypothetical protein
MAIPVLVSFTENSSTGASSRVLTKPASVAVGDLLVIIAATDDTSNLMQFKGNAIPGFTEIGGLGNSSMDVHIAAFYRVVDGTEGASFTVTSSSSDDFTCWCLRITGANRWNPIDAIDDGYATSTVDAVIPAVTTTVNDCLVLACHAYDGGDNGTYTITGTGWTSVDQNKTGSGSGNLSAGVARRDQATAGAGTACTFNASGSLSDGNVGFQFAIAPVNSPNTLAGITKDNDGAALGSCDVYCWKKLGDDSWLFIGHQVSNGTTGAYSFATEDTDASYMVVASKADSPHVFDVTDYVLAPV